MSFCGVQKVKIRSKSLTTGREKGYNKTDKLARPTNKYTTEGERLFMKKSWRRLALVLAAALVFCFALTGCEPAAAGTWNIDLEGNEVDETAYKKNSDGGWTITRKYVVDEAAVAANNRAIAAQEVTIDDMDTVLSVSRVYAVSKLAIEEMVNTLPSYGDTGAVKYITFTFTYSGYGNGDSWESVVIKYSDTSGKAISAKYDGSGSFVSGTNDSSTLNPILGAILSQAVGSGDAFETALTNLAKTAYYYGDNLAMDTWAERQNLTD